LKSHSYNYSEQLGSIINYRGQHMSSNHPLKHQNLNANLCIDQLFMVIIIIIMVHQIII